MKTAPERVAILQTDGSYKDADGNYTLPQHDINALARAYGRLAEEKMAREQAAREAVR